MEKNWRNKKESKRYNESEIKKLRTFKLENGETEIKGRGRVIEIGLKQSLKRTDKIKHWDLKERIPRQSKERSRLCEVREERIKGLLKHAETIRIPQKQQFKVND